jgi:hypothetical protein
VLVSGEGAEVDAAGVLVSGEGAELDAAGVLVTFEGAKLGQHLMRMMLSSIMSIHKFSFSNAAHVL